LRVRSAIMAVILLRLRSAGSESLSRGSFHCAPGFPVELPPRMIGSRQPAKGEETAGPSTTLRSGRDDTSVSVSKSRPQDQFVIPTGAKRSGGTCCFWRPAKPPVSGQPPSHPHADHFPSKRTSGRTWCRRQL
jgi:hypothetical protein